MVIRTMLLYDGLLSIYMSERYYMYCPKIGLNCTRPNFGLLDYNLEADELTAFRFEQLVHDRINDT